MKRFILIIVLILSSLGASAQISNVKTSEAIKTITRFRYGFCSLNDHKGVYYLGLNSSNQFDDPFLVYLGEGRESALRSLLDILDLFDGMKKGEFVEFTISVQGRDYKYRGKKSNKMSFTFYDTGLAGDVFISRGEIETLIDRFASFELE